MVLSLLEGHTGGAEIEWHLFSNSALDAPGTSAQDKLLYLPESRRLFGLQSLPARFWEGQKSLAPPEIESLIL